MNLPKYLYKYRTFDSNHLKSIIDNEIWFAIGTTLNDPFDCTVNFPNIRADRDSLMRFAKARKLGQIPNTNSCSGLTMAWINELESRGELLGDKGNKYMLRIYQVLINAYVCCFSTSFKNQLLWSHYSNHHKGICLRFNTEKLISSIDNVFHDWITYDNAPMNMVDLINSKDQQKAAMDIIYTKSKDWDYEKEYRLILDNIRKNKNDPEAQPIKYPEDALDCIFFGIEVNKNKKQNLIESLKGRNILFKDVYRAETSYELFSRDTKTTK